MGVENVTWFEIVRAVGEQIRETLEKVARETGKSMMEKLQEKFDFGPKGHREEREERQLKLTHQIRLLN